LIVESKKMADRYDTLFNMHFARSTEEVEECVARTGRRPVENLHHLNVLDRNVVLVHMLQVNDAEMKLLSETGATAVYCPSTSLKLVYGMPRSGRFPEMLDAGVNVSLGTDAGDCANYQDMIRVMYLGAVLFKDLRFDPKVMGAEAAIEMATIRGARALGMEKEIGSLEVGKKADIIIVDMTGADWIPRYNPIQNLVYSAAGNSVETVIIDGRMVMEGREIKGAPQVPGTQQEDSGQERRYGNSYTLESDLTCRKRLSVPGRRRPSIDHCCEVARTCPLRAIDSASRRQREFTSGFLVSGLTRAVRWGAHRHHRQPAHIPVGSAAAGYHERRANTQALGPAAACDRETADG
jgi:hypothetical protein